MSNKALYDRLVAIANEQLDDRSISPGEAAYLLKVLGEIQDAEPLPGEPVADTQSGWSPSRTWPHRWARHWLERRA